MAEEGTLQIAEKGRRKRNIGKKKGGKAKKLKVFPGTGEKVRINGKMKKLFRRRARDYNSDDDDDESGPVDRDEKVFSAGKVEEESGDSSDGEGEDEKDVGIDKEDSEGEEEEDDEIQPGITKFAEGCRAFRIAFKNITKKSKADDALGPVLSAHKQLIAQKLAEEEAERKVKGEAKNEKHLMVEKGHVKPANYLDSHEKFLLGVATKGVVKLFNAVNKAQTTQKGLNPSRFKDAKVIQKQRKEAFFSELSKKSLPKVDGAAKGPKSSSSVDDEGPAWAPLRDNYMLTNPKLKDWDKKQDAAMQDDIERMSEDSCSDDD